MIPWLEPDEPFPPVGQALRQPNGLLAASEDVSAARLLDAYSHGIFPWYSDGEPVLWWSPQPRMILAPREFKMSRSLRKRLRALAQVGRDSAVGVEQEAGHSDQQSDSARAWIVQSDHAFECVMRACAQPRPDQDHTWITEPMIAAYVQLHRLGHAHSIEAWERGVLIGGLYGVCLGRMFYGESMFARATDASKICLAILVQIMLHEDVAVIDCQQSTHHLASLGGREISRNRFCAHVARATSLAPIDWSAYRSIALNPLLDAYRSSAA